jgi:hypothetical protein
MLAYMPLDTPIGGNFSDFTRARTLTPEVALSIDDAFDFYSWKDWTDQQAMAGSAIRLALAEAVKAIVAGAPPSADRSSAIRKVREAWMDANSAITHAGKY